MQLLPFLFVHRTFLTFTSLTLSIRKTMKRVHTETVFLTEWEWEGSPFFYDFVYHWPKAEQPKIHSDNFSFIGHLWAHSFIIQSFFKITWCGLVPSIEIWKQRHLVIVRKTPLVTSNDRTKWISYQIQQSRYKVQLIFSFLRILRKAKRLAFLSRGPFLTVCLVFSLSSMSCYLALFIALLQGACWEAFALIVMCKIQAAIVCFS